LDSKSLGCIIHAGSSPASGTIVTEKKPDCSDALWLFLFLHTSEERGKTTLLPPSSIFSEKETFAWAQARCQMFWPSLANSVGAMAKSKYKMEGY